MELSLRDMVMEPRPDWNSRGPRLPAWFRLALSRIDSRLVPQFIPPRGPGEQEGVDAMQFPRGVWVICRLMRGTGWLLKRWIWSLADVHGQYQEPGPDTIAVLRMARDLWRRNCVGDMERQMDDAIASVKSSEAQRSKERMQEYVSRLCRAHNIVRGHSRVFMREKVEGHKVEG